MIKRLCEALILFLLAAFTRIGDLYCGQAATDSFLPSKNSPHHILKKKIKAAVPVQQPLNLKMMMLEEKPPEDNIKEPRDLMNLIPVVRDINRLIPKRFSIADHQVTLNSSNRVVIEHQFLDFKARTTPKNSVITLFYNGGIGGSTGTNLEVPLCYSPSFLFSDWNVYPVGNYTMTLTRNGYTEDSLFIRAQTRF